MAGVFQSFNDAPGGFSEELDEFTWAIGAEYLYQDSFALRLGYFNENEFKGARKFFAMGAGFKYSAIDIDLKKFPIPKIVVSKEDMLANDKRVTAINSKRDSS